MRKAAMLATLLFVALYVAILAYVFAPPPVRNLTYRLQVKLYYYVWATNPADRKGVLKGEHKMAPINGSAAAISANGDLLTVRHAVDANWYLPWPCGKWIDDGVEMSIRIESLELLVTSSNGHQWRGIAHPENSDGPWCDEQEHLRLVWDSMSDARIVIMDDAHDLALVSIKVLSPIPYARLQRGQAIAGQDVKICGFPKGSAGIKVYSGIVMIPCTIVNENNILKSLPIIHVTPRAEHGVSGGPIVVGNRLVGTVLSPEGRYQTVGVPGFYITKWLDWVNGRTLKLSEPVCSP